MKHIYALSAVLLLAACGSEKSGTITTDDGEVSYKVEDEGDGTGSMTIKSDDGEVNIVAGENAKVSLPAGFSRYPGAKVLSSMNMSSDGEAHSSLTMTTGDSVDKVVAFYRRQAEAAGVKISSEIKADNAVMLSGQSPSGLVFSINAGPGDDGTNAHLALVQNKGG